MPRAPLRPRSSLHGARAWVPMDRSDDGTSSDGRTLAEAWRTYLEHKKSVTARVRPEPSPERGLLRDARDLDSEDLAPGWDADDPSEEDLEPVAGWSVRAPGPAADPTLVVTALQSLEEEDRLLVQLLSLSCMALSPGELLRVLQHGTLPGHQQTAAELAPRLARLEGVGLLRGERSGSFGCVDGCAQLALREAVERPDFAALRRAVERALQPPTQASRWGIATSPRSVAAALREARVAIVTGDETTLRRTYATAQRQGVPLVRRATLVACELGSPFDASWFGQRPRELQDAAALWLLRDGLYNLQDVGPVVDEVWRWWRDQVCPLPGGLRQALAVNLLLRDRVSDAQALILGSDDGELLGCAGWVDLAQGEVERACAFFEQGLRALQRDARYVEPYFSSVAGLVYPVALLARGRDADLEQLLHLESDSLTQGRLGPALRALLEVAWLWRTPSAVRARHRARAKPPASGEVELPDLLASWAQGLLAWWTEAVPDPGLLRALAQGAARCQRLGLHWLEDQLADLTLRLAPAAPIVASRDPAAAALPLAALVTPRPQWLRTLEALAAVGRVESGAGEPARRLAWFLDLADGPRLSVREQRRTKRGGFSQGRLLSEARLGELVRGVGELSPQDLELCRALRAAREDDPYAPGLPLSARVARALVGHPLVFWDDHPDQPIDVALGRPELHVQRRADGGVRVRLVPTPVRGDGATIVRDGPARALVVELDARQREVAAILGEGLELPARAEQRFIEALSSTVTVLDVQSELDLALAGVEERTADPRPRARVAFVGKDLRVELVARPLGDVGPALVPGQGSTLVVTNVDAQRVLVRRDLADELQRASACIEACPTLGSAAGADLRWRITDPQRSLELLAELRALGDAVVLEWSSEGRMRVRAEVGLSRLRVRMGSGRDWFGVQGELRVDPELVLDMRRLLELSELMPGRFVPLGDGEFLALSVELRRRLDALRDLTQVGPDGLRVHPLAAGAVDQVLRGAGEVERSADFGARVDALERALRSEPVLPTAFTLEPRPYQVEGFAWLARLTAGGMGACLADDMGLGKTAQVLALLLHRHSEGPALVVAPTTVCGTWRDQAARYAPSLRVVELGASERARTIASLGPGDLLLCSYALLVREVSELRQVSFCTVVLDEAQAVKNANTKRWQAAASVQAGARVVTTGTPVENHLDELWSLFEFLNPGLLGTREAFARRFAVPVERDRDRERLAHLRSLVAPYILRRTKQQVLAELPPRTEIELEIEMGAAERAHYEAIRQRALDRLVQPGAGAAQTSHVRILAEITRLRRACSNPAMISPDAGLPSCKLEACIELLEQLRQGDHRVLVFSQWLDQLAALQQRLDALGFRQLYLDGATPAAERQQRIDAFQAGQAEVFLISLKAGGQGINLTAADYVVHVDPWWNPAVEDQASDRAHRLGQTRPVTVYRLVVKDSIEQKILALHHAKRDLASQILAGGEMAAKLSADELLDLLRQAG